MRILTYLYTYDRLKNGKPYFVDGLDDSKFTTSKNEMLCNFLFYCNDKKIDFEILINKLTNALNIIKDFNEDSFYSISRDLTDTSNKLHEVFMEALIIAVCTTNEIKISKDKFDKIKKQIWGDENLKNKFTVATTNLTNLQNRVNYLIDIISVD